MEATARCDSARRAIALAPGLRQGEALVQTAGLRDARLHDAPRPPALLGVPDRAIMGIMRWSSDQHSRYQRLTDPILKDVATRIGRLLWEEAAGPADRPRGANETKTETSRSLPGLRRQTRSRQTPWSDIKISGGG